MAGSERGLEDRTVVVTRDEGTDGPLSSELERRGAQVLLWPTVRSTSPEDSEPLETALAALDSYDWIAFTSARAATAVLERHPEAPESVGVAVVGGGTGRTLRAGDWPVDLEPEDASSPGLLREFITRLGEEQLRGIRVLFPASSLAERTLVEGLAEHGARVDEVVAYRTESVSLQDEARRRVRNIMDRGPEWRSESIDAICFASPSAVRTWSEAFDAEQFATIGRRLQVVAIGERTEAALDEAGCQNILVAGDHSFVGLADILTEKFTRVPGRETRR